MSAALAKMQTLATELKASMPEDDDVRPLHTPSPQASKRTSAGVLGSKPASTKRGAAKAAADGAPADVAQLALDYEEIRHRYEEVLKENETFKMDTKRRLESHTRREHKYRAEIDELRAELERQATAKPKEESHVERLRVDHKKVLQGISSLQERTSSELHEQEKDLLRAFRARLYDVQIELERERSKKDDGALEWIEKTRSLGKELDWSREEALRLDRANQSATKENSRLKAQLKAQADDREFLVRQMIALKKENARLKPAAAAAAAAARSPGGASGGVGSPSSSSCAASALGLSPPGAARPHTSAGGRGADGGGADGGGGESLATAERVKELTLRQSESDARYREVVAKLKRLLEVERRNLRAVRAAHAKELQSRTELETLLRSCVQDVQHEIANQRAGGGGAAGKREVAAGNFSAADRERVMELLLSQQRVVTLLYERTFPPREPSSHPLLLGSGVDVEDEPPSPTGEAVEGKGGGVGELLIANQPGVGEQLQGA